MEKIFLTTIQENVVSLFDAAELLALKAYYGPAIHLMMSAREELVKWITLHCWEHLDKGTRSQIFRHEFKHKAAGVFHFLRGELEMVDFAIGAVSLIKERNPKIDQETDTVIADLPTLQSIVDPRRLADVIIRSLTMFHEVGELMEVWNKRKEDMKRRIDEAELIRQNSIYVDFNSNLEIAGEPKKFAEGDYRTIKKDVLLAKYYIEKLSGSEPSKEILYDIFPELKDEIEKMLAELKIKLDKVPRE